MFKFDFDIEDDTTDLESNVNISIPHDSQRSTTVIDKPSKEILLSQLVSLFHTIHQ